MYAEPFKFIFSEKLLDSERMKLLAEMFQMTEEKGIEGRSYGGYKITGKGEVNFWSYMPNLTDYLVSWLTDKKAEGKITILKPKCARGKNA